MSLRYLKNEVRDEVDFLDADERQSFYELAWLFLMKVTRHVKSTQNSKFAIFLLYI